MTDTTALLAPINEASPCGADLLFSADFDAIQHARRYDDPSLDQGEWITEIKEADWPFVVEHCTTLLRTQTKDLRLAVWLTEALAIQAGVPGLTQGYALLTGLVERYWEHLHPLPDGDDEDRLGNVAWLAGRSAQLLRSVPLTQSGVAFSTIDWDVAMHVAQAVKRDPDHADDIARGKPSLEQIEASKRATPASFYKALLAELKAFEASVDALDAALDARAGDAAPSFRQVRDACESVYRLAERFARDVGVDTDAAAAAQPAALPPASSAAVERAEPSFKSPLPVEDTMPNPIRMPARAHAGIHSRAEAVAQLRAVAVFFREAEPHSPAAYLADKAAEWAEMPLHQWLSSVVKDDGTLAQIREMLGVKADGV